MLQKCTAPILNSALLWSSAAVGSYLVILVGRDRNEGGLGENVRAEGRVFGAESVVLVGLDDVDPRLILVHGVQDDLWRSKRRVGMGDGGENKARDTCQSRL